VRSVRCRRRSVSPSGGFTSPGRRSVVPFERARKLLKWRWREGRSPDITLTFLTGRAFRNDLGDHGGRCLRHAGRRDLNATADNLTEVASSLLGPFWQRQNHASDAPPPHTNHDCGARCQAEHRWIGGCTRSKRSMRSPERSSPGALSFWPPLRYKKLSSRQTSGIWLPNDCDWRCQRSSVRFVLLG
jgi:hypothetical protein